jgi:hypothetical protein
MLPENHNYYKQTWVFHVQNAEDFYNQLRAAHREDAEREEEIDVENTELAEQMLQAIGIKTQ